MTYNLNDIKNLTDQDLPADLHGKIIKKIYFMKLRAPLLFLSILSAINLAESGWHLFSKASEMETFSIIHTLAGQFELSFDYFASLFAATVENAPLHSVLPFVINLILMISLLYLIKIFAKVEKNLNY